jgi:nitrogen-specific signal transduction histidine kinase
MENSHLGAEIDNKSLTSFLSILNSTSPEFISGGNGVFMEGDGSDPFGLLQNGKPNLNKSGRNEGDFFGSDNKDNPAVSFPKEDEVKPAESKKDPPIDNQAPSFMDSFLIELVHNIKNALTSIYHATVLTADKYDDAEIRDRSHTQVKEEIKKIDSILNSVLNFINISTPVTRTNVLYTILDEILEANEKQLQQKNIKIIRRCEKDLPDTFIHPEQVRFILHSVLQCAILSISPNESIGFLMRSSDNGTGTEKPSPEDNRKYIEVMIGFNGNGKAVNPLESSPDTPGDQKDGMADLILKLAKEVLQRNHGMMVETHGERLKNLINLRFPVERRKVVYYEPIAI